MEVNTPFIYTIKVSITCLNEQATVITPLEVITDKATITKLETYRKK
jgi:hypothetical protein